MTTITRLKTIAASLCVAVVLAACGGGGGSTSIPPGGSIGAPSPQASGATGNMGSLTFTIAVPTPPPGASARVRSQYVSANTASVRITLLSVDGHAVTNVPDTIATIAPGAQGCSAKSATDFQCSIVANEPLGLNDAFRISTYASSNATGTVLATSTVDSPVGGSTNAPIALSLGGVVSSVVIAPTRLVAPTDGTVQSYTISVTGVDASGATIIGSTPFSSPIALSIQNDPNHALTLSNPEVTTPGQPVQLTFDSTKTLTDAKITAAAPSGTAPTADFVTLTYSPITATVAMGGAPLTISVSEAGFTGQFSISVADSTVASAAISPTVNGQATITVTPPPTGGYPGQTTITLTAGAITTTIPLNVIYPVLQTKTWNVGGTGESMAPAPDGVSFNVGDDGAARVYNFNPQTGTLIPIQQNTPDGVFAIANGPDNNAWWVISGYPQTQLCQGVDFQNNYNVSCYNLTGAYSQSNSFGLAAGPNNTLWMTLAAYQTGIAIAKYDIASGTFTYYTNGLTPNSNPYALAFGPDGNVWFTDTSQTAPAIGKLDISTGTITEYPLQTGNGSYGSESFPTDIVAGPDGNMWFTDNSQGSPGIGKIAPATGTVTMYTHGLQRVTQPLALTVGPDNNIWFTDVPQQSGGFNLVGSLNPTTGAIQEYSLSTPGLQLEPIITVGTKLEAISTYGIPGNFSAFAAEITLPSTSVLTRRRQTVHTRP